MIPSIQRIVVGTDFSEHAEQAVQRAARLAAAHGAIVELVHAAPMPAPMPVWGDMAGGTWIGDRELIEAAGRRLSEQCRELGDAHGIEVGFHCNAGPVVRLLRERADALDASLIVAGATGEGAIARRLFGSTAHAIVRGTPRAVLVVRLAPTASYGHLLVASDFSDDAERAARFARALAPTARLSMFGALEQPRLRGGWFENLDEATRLANLERARESARSRLREFAASPGDGDALVNVRDGRASHEVAAVVTDSGADLLSIGAHGKSRLEAGLLGSTSLHAVAEVGCDVLVMPPETE
jgi:nucleotide-binding universal stress UspA family protein